MIISSSRLILITVLDGKNHAMIPSDVKNEDLINQTLQLIKHCCIKCLIKLPATGTLVLDRVEEEEGGGSGRGPITASPATVAQSRTDQSRSRSRFSPSTKT